MTKALAVKNDEFNVEVGRRLRVARLSAGWTQTRLANLLGLTFQQVQKYETGRNRLPASRYAALATAIGFDVSDLLDGAPSCQASQRELMEIWSSLDQQGRDRLLEHGRFLLSQSD